ncbi:MAG: hypothetical protein DWQ01_20155 [Planctomycetota bacterium]|nr:MAG: hypothetical protein DWQ01_20155 [Planctomycetota bacterium]
MKDQYFGDVHDFAKYAFLRHWTEAGWGPFLVGWYRTPPDGRSDGGQLHYLEEPEKWRHRDPPLFDFLKERIGAGVRQLKAVEDSGLLRGARFHRPELSPQPQRRRSWRQTLVADAGFAKSLFLDPDNGLEIPSLPPGRKGSERYVLWSELQDLWPFNKPIFIYQHLPRRDRRLYFEQWSRRIERRLSGCHPKLILGGRIGFWILDRNGRPEVSKLLPPKWADRFRCQFQTAME